VSNLFCKVEKQGQVAPVGQLRARLSQLVEKGVRTGLNINNKFQHKAYQRTIIIKHTVLKIHTHKKSIKQDFKNSNQFMNRICRTEKQGQKTKQKLESEKTRANAQKP
jgi:hypothetical protein